MQVASQKNGMFAVHEAPPPTCFEEKKYGRKRAHISNHVRRALTIQFYVIRFLQITWQWQPLASQIYYYYYFAGSEHTHALQIY